MPARFRSAVDNAIAFIPVGGACWGAPGLASLVVELRKRAGEMGVALVTPDRLQNAIRTLGSEGAQALGSSHLVALAYHLATPSPLLENRAVLQEPLLVGDFLARLSVEYQTRPRPILWRGVFASYFVSPPGAPGLPLLRNWLRDHLAPLRKRDPRPYWVDGVDRHAAVFGKDPTRVYADEWLRGKEEQVNDLKAAVDVPASSWFWPQMLDELVDRACAESGDRQFALGVSRSLALAERLGFQPGTSRTGDRMLARLLNRHAKVAGQPRDEALLVPALEAWGNPQLGLASEAHKWSDVSEDALTMVCGWLAEEDLQDFAELVKRNGHVDDRRLNYWLRFKRQISFTQLAISVEILHSKDPDVVKFRKRKGSRLARYSDTEASAIIIRIGDVWFVEFSKTGNACYPYHSKALPFGLGEKVHSAATLKHRAATFPAAGRTLLHQREWEEEFDRFLSNQNIWPDAMNRKPAKPTHSIDRFQPRRAGSAAPKAPVPPQAPAPPELSHGPPMRPPVWEKTGLSDELTTVLMALGGVVVDNRPKDGGLLWVKLRAQPTMLIRMRMKDFGYHFAESANGFWRK